MPQHQSTPAATAAAPVATATTATPAPAATTAATTPTAGTHHLSDKTLVMLDVLVGIIGSLFGHGMGQQIAKWFQGARQRATTPSLPPLASTTTTTQETSTATIDPTLHSALLGIGPWDEAATGMTLGVAFGRACQRLAEATGTVLEAPIRAAANQLWQTVAFISTTLTQHERNFLREVVSKLKTAQLQTQFWQNLVLASKDEPSFVAFLRAMGIIRDPNEFTQELAAAIAYGFEQANVVRLQMVSVLTPRLDARSAAAKQQWLAAQGQPAQGNTASLWHNRKTWLVIGLVILAVVLYLTLPHFHLKLW